MGLGEDDAAERKLASRLEQIDLSILTSVALNVDRENSDGNTVSGYIVCYKHRWEGNNDFSIINLEYTSLEVEGKVLNKLRVLSTKKHMQGVSRRLDGELVDLSVELLSRGTAYQWVSCEVGSDWVQFTIAKKRLKRTYTIG